jgi:hypothetical protein
MRPPIAACQERIFRWIESRTAGGRVTQRSQETEVSQRGCRSNRGEPPKKRAAMSPQHATLISMKLRGWNGKKGPATPRSGLQSAMDHSVNIAGRARALFGRLLRTWVAWHKNSKTRPGSGTSTSAGPTKRRKIRSKNRSFDQINGGLPRTRRCSNRRLRPRCRAHGHLCRLDHM